MARSDAQLARLALAIYMERGGRVLFRDSGATHPRRRQPFALTFSIQDPEAYDAIWRRLMQRSLSRSSLADS